MIKLKTTSPQYEGFKVAFSATGIPVVAGDHTPYGTFKANFMVSDTTDVQSVFVRAFHGGATHARRIVANLTMPQGVTILGWVVDRQNDMGHLAATDALFSPTGGAPANAAAASHELPRGRVDASQ